MRNYNNPEVQRQREQEILNSLPDLDELEKVAQANRLVIHETDKYRPVNIRARQVEIIRDFNGERITRNYQNDQQRAMDHMKKIDAAKSSVSKEANTSDGELEFEDPE